jgi:membrane-associated phospholipid phosphatase
MRVHRTRTELRIECNGTATHAIGRPPRPRRRVLHGVGMPTPGVPAALDPRKPPPTEVFPAPVALHRGRAASTVAWICLAAFAGLFGLVKARRSDAVDLAVTLKLQHNRHPLLERLMSLVSWPGFPPQSRLIPPIGIGFLFLLSLPVEAAFLVAAWGTSLLSTVVKSLVSRPRPIAGEQLRVVVAPLGGSSFPSGHVLSYVGLYGFAAYLAEVLIRPMALRRTVVGALLGLVALVGPSRIQQGHHWFTDVTASYLLGTSYVVAVAALYRRVKARRARVKA